MWYVTKYFLLFCDHSALSYNIAESTRRLNGETVYLKQKVLQYTGVSLYQSAVVGQVTTVCNRSDHYTNNPNHDLMHLHSIICTKLSHQVSLVFAQYVIFHQRLVPHQLRHRQKENKLRDEKKERRGGFRSTDTLKKKAQQLTQFFH